MRVATGILSLVAIFPLAFQAPTWAAPIAPSQLDRATSGFLRLLLTAVVVLAVLVGATIWGASLGPGPGGPAGGTGPPGDQRDRALIGVPSNVAPTLMPTQ